MDNERQTVDNIKYTFKVDDSRKMVYGTQLIGTCIHCRQNTLKKQVPVVLMHFMYIKNLCLSHIALFLWDNSSFLF